MCYHDPMDLAQKKCVACEGGVAPMTRADAKAMLACVPGWELAPDGTSVSRAYRFKDFAAALSFVDGVGAVAEREGHHPDIEMGWGRVRITLSTHAIGGLSENDFIMAAKINRLA